MSSDLLDIVNDNDEIIGEATRAEIHARGLLHRENLIRHLSPRDATVDLVRAIVEEINLLNQPYSSFKDWFNFTPSKFSYSVYVYEEKSESDYPWKFKEVFDLDFQLGRTGSSNDDDLDIVSSFPGIYRYGKFVRQDEKGIYISIQRQHVDSELSAKRNEVNIKIKKLKQEAQKNKQNVNSDDDDCDITDDISEIAFVSNSKEIKDVDGIPPELIKLQRELEAKAIETVIVRFTESSYSQSSYNTEKTFKS
jgi:hypothetical protein